MTNAPRVAQRPTWQIGASTFSWMWLEPALEVLARLREAGLDGFDIVSAPGHLSPDELSQDDRRKLKDAARQLGARIDSLNLPALDHNLASCLGDVRAAAVKIYGQLCELADDLDIRKVVVVPGRVSALLPPPQDAVQGWLRDSIGKLARIAERRGQTLLLENHPMTSLPGAQPLLAFAQSLGLSQLKVAYDIANAEFIGEDQAAAIRVLGPHLGQLHVSDGTRSNWRHDGLGAGTVNIRSICEALSEIGYTATAVLEIVSPNADEEMRTSLQRLTEASTPR
jgi:L-ribulose-5-phosphate 3-epimerase